ncbi:MAG TPA: ABC transporter substrate-binding protein [Chloroflexota bacterium]|nr:ABC transporter substrate-binding protein [Chloroflexota bacterium]HZU06475.1 ABC transporter substrate-binding protein [Chloroflexota bacterium]
MRILTLRGRSRPAGLALLRASMLLLLAACAGGGVPSAAPARPPGAAVSPAGEAVPPPLRLVVSWSQPGGGQSGIWMAYEAGLFHEQGLDVELTHIPNTSRVIQAMVAGEVQLAPLDVAATLQASLGGAELALYFGALNRLVYSVMAQPEITEPQLLRGKTVGITRIGSATHTATLLALERWGLVPDRDVALRQLGEVNAVLAGLEAKQVDAGVISPPRSTLARRAGYRELLNLATDGPDYPSLAIGGPRSWATANAEAMRRFARAYVLGIQRLKQDKPWAIEVYRKYLGLDDPVVLDDTYELFSQLFPLPPYVSEAGLARLLADLAEDEPRLAGRQPSEWIDARYLREVEAAGAGHP